MNGHPATPNKSLPEALSATAVIYSRVSTKEQAERDGDPEGYSIPAQRDACSRKAASLGAQVLEQFVDRGESARSADRPELQRMLIWLAEHPVDYVIVHKVDRLARNRMDDVTITAAIQASGAQLVSVTENIDETPSGALLHGIMSSIAEFYSRNLANEVIKGTQQKVLAGGTPTRAPIGYRNIRREIDGYEVRTVEIDSERAELIAWAFLAYASGAYSLARLAAELEARGLTYRATAKQASRPIQSKKLGDLLGNRYYLGIVTWRGVEYQGKHQPLVTPDVFNQVQAVLTAHRTSGERSYRHQHYLAGTLFCERCSSKLIYSVATGKQGDRYDYFLCLGRHTKKNGCDLPYLPVPAVEAAVTRHWRAERPSLAQADDLRSGLLADLASHEGAVEEERARLTTRQQAIQRDRFKWAEKAMTGSVPDDIARDKQHQLGNQLEQVETQLARLSTVSVDTHELVERACTIAEHIGESYGTASSSVRRDFNQGWFEGLYLDVGSLESGIGGEAGPRVARAVRTEFGESLMSARVVSRNQSDVAERGGASMDETGSDLNDVLDLEIKQRRSLRYGVVSRVRGSNVSCLVELRRLELLTPSMQTRLGIVASSPQQSAIEHMLASLQLRPDPKEGLGMPEKRRKFSPESKEGAVQELLTSVGERASQR